MIEKQWECFGLKCVVLFNSYGHRCGYVGIDESHPLYRADYSCEPLYMDINVHGGLTWSELGNNDYPVPTSSKTWWFGFDCAHSGDGKDIESLKKYGLALSHLFSKDGGHVWTLDEVVNECESLAAQLSDTDKWRQAMLIYKLKQL